MSLRVGIAYSFHDADWFGGRNYFASLFRAVQVTQAISERIQFVFITGKNVRTSLPDEFPELEVWRTEMLDRMRPSWFARQVALRLLDSDPPLGALLRRAKIDVLSHSGQVGKRRDFKTIDWLYDFQFMHLPEYWQPKHIRWAEQRYRASCRNADGLLVSSHNALSDLDHFAPWCDIPKQVLHFVSNPVDFANLPTLKALQSKYPIPSDFFYLPNQFWTSKNHGLVIKALHLLMQEGIEATVVCTGKEFDGRRPDYFSQLMQSRSEHGVDNRFLTLGSLPYQDTQALMAHCRAVINPSRFEGWSTTVEEAKSLGKVLLLSDIPVHREQSPQRGRFFATDDAAGLAHLMKECMQEAVVAIDETVLTANYDLRLREFGSTYVSFLHRMAR